MQRTSCEKIRWSAALVLLSASLIVIVATSALAQKLSGASSPKIVSRSQLVLVPVVVRDKSGRHAKGLTKQDFIVQENGAERVLAFSEEVTTSSEPIPRPAASGEFTNINAANTAPRRLVIMALDRINTPMFDQNYARHQMGKFLSSALNDNALIALVTVDIGGLKVVRDFTDDRDALLAELAKLRSSPDTVTTSSKAPLTNSVRRAQSLKHCCRTSRGGTTKLVQRREQGEATSQSGALWMRWRNSLAPTPACLVARR
ncbi:MAG TPA: VWA domain-containing protein [Terriglobales bacterium]|nr:VWA domain-containing protein [Terriglobales bacterium]